MFCHKTKQNQWQNLGPHLSICLKKKNHKSTKLNTGYLEAYLWKHLKKFEMSSSVLPAALRRRRMGLADGLDIGSLLSYGFLITRRELRSSVGWSIVEGWTFFQRHGSQLSDSKLSNNQSGVRTRLNWTFNKLAFPCKLAGAFSARYSIQNPPLL